MQAIPSSAKGCKSYARREQPSHGVEDAGWRSPVESSLSPRELGARQSLEQTSAKNWSGVQSWTCTWLT